MQILFMLELDGYIKCVAGNKYIKRNDIMINQRQELGREGEDLQQIIYKNKVMKL